jgi:hypothetical protein
MGEQIERPDKDAMPDQRSTIDQLITLHQLANEYKLYDAADAVKDIIGWSKK